MSAAVCFSKGPKPSQSRSSWPNLDEQSAGPGGAVAIYGFPGRLMASHLWMARTSRPIQLGCAGNRETQPLLQINRTLAARFREHEIGNRRHHPRSLDQRRSLRQERRHRACWPLGR
jgi:hypothetical protein